MDHMMRTDHYFLFETYLENNNISMSYIGMLTVIYIAWEICCDNDNISLWMKLTTLKVVKVL